MQNYVERSIVLATDEKLGPELFPPHVRGLSPVRIDRSKSRGLDVLCSDLVTLGMTQASHSEARLYERIVSMVEKELIIQVLRVCQGVQTKAASRLGINRNTLHKKIDDYALNSEVR